MSSDTEARIARLERAVQQGLNVDLNEFNDPDQQEAQAKQEEADQNAAEKQAAKAEKDAEAETAAAAKGGGN